MTKTCSCGAHFSLHVELAVHRQLTGHCDAQNREMASVPVASVRPKARQWKKSVLAGALLVSVIGFTAGVNASIRTYTSWSQTANVLVLP